MIGVAVKSQRLTMVEPGKEDVIELPYDISGLKQIEEKKENVVLVGNYFWAKPLAYGLQRSGVQVNYLPSPGLPRRGRQQQEKYLITAIDKGLVGRPFFREPKPREDTPHPWVELANEYHRANDEIRRIKHRILNCLRILWPELIITLEDKLWTQKSLKALKERRWNVFQLSLEDSLSKFIPIFEKQKAERELEEELKNLEILEGKKKDIIERIDAEVEEHPGAKAYNNSLVAKLLILQVGWKKWGTNKKGFRALRNYCGLAVNRLDSTGKARISRKRGEVRQNLFLLLRSKRGKRIIEEAQDRLGKTRMGRPERLEYLLKDIFKMLN